jgi:hypothetical protein
VVVPERVNGLGLSGPPNTIHQWTKTLYEQMMSSTKCSNDPELSAFRKTYGLVFSRISQQHRGSGGNGGSVGSSNKRIRMSKDGERHPDLYAAKDWEIDKDRYHPMREIGDKLTMSGGGGTKQKRGAATGASFPSTSTNNRNSSNSNKNSSKDYTILIYDNAIKYKEPTAMISMDVFKCTMDNIRAHVDTSITKVSSESTQVGGSRNIRGGITNFEQLDRRIQRAMVRKKQELTELLRYFWGAAEQKDFSRIQQMYERVNDYGEKLRRWKDKDLTDAKTRSVIEPFVLVMTTQVAKVREKVEQMAENQRKKRQRKASGKNRK